MNCPSCGTPLSETELHEDNGCLFGVALTQLRDRYAQVEGPPPITPAHVLELDLSVADTLWETFGGPMLDWLETQFNEQTRLELDH